MSTTGLHPELEQRVADLGARIAALQELTDSARPARRLGLESQLHELQRRHDNLKQRLHQLDAAGRGFSQATKAELLLLADDLMGAIEDLMMMTDADFRPDPHRKR